MNGGIYQYDVQLGRVQKLAKNFVVSAEIFPRPFVVSAEIAAPHRPLSYREEVELACAPANARLNQAWDRCVESVNAARICNHVSLVCTERAVQHANNARQLLTLARCQLQAV